MNTGAAVASAQATPKAQRNPLYGCIQKARRSGHAVHSIRDLLSACGLAVTAGFTSTITGNTGEIYGGAGDGPGVAAGQGCSVPDNLILQGASCNGGTNQIWSFVLLNNGYDAIMANYGGHLVCATVHNDNVAAGTQIYGTACDNNVISPSEQWREPEHTEDPHWSHVQYRPYVFYVVPSQNFSLCWNVQGGLTEGNDIGLATQTSAKNVAWAFWHA
jgi:hypothetical protein